MNTHLAGKTVLITGATSGIGLATAELLVENGANVIGVGRTAGKCEEADSKLKPHCRGGLRSGARASENPGCTALLPEAGDGRQDPIA